jgi:prevent-host-death family protein
VSLKQARQRLGDLVDAATRGETVVITRRGRGVARLVALDASPERLPDLTAFRASLQMQGAPLSETVLAARRDERY